MPESYIKNGRLTFFTISRIRPVVPPRSPRQLCDSSAIVVRWFCDEGTYKYRATTAKRPVILRMCRERAATPRLDDCQLEGTKKPPFHNGG